MNDDGAEAWSLAVVAARTFRPWVLPFDERVCVAAGAIGEAFALGERDRGALITAGLRAIATETQKYRSLYGLPGNGRTGTGAKHAVYWRGTGRLAGADPVGDRVLEPIALAQVWHELSERDRVILKTAAAIAGGSETPAAAARLAGCTPATYLTLLSRARARARRLWFDWERAPGHFQRHRRRTAA